VGILLAYAHLTVSVTRRACRQPGLVGSQEISIRDVASASMVGVWIRETQMTDIASHLESILVIVLISDEASYKNPWRKTVRQLFQFPVKIPDFKPLQFCQFQA
jgi:hypothetical protein